MKKRQRLPDPVQILPDVMLPRGHLPGMRVPYGGSSCGNCRFGNVKTNTCSEPNFIRWNGSRRIPVLMDEYCSDWWQPRRKGT